MSNSTESPNNKSIGRIRQVALINRSPRRTMLQKQLLASQLAEIEAAAAATAIDEQNKVEEKKRLERKARVARMLAWLAKLVGRKASIKSGSE